MKKNICIKGKKETIKKTFALKVKKRILKKNICIKGKKENIEKTFALKLKKKKIILKKHLH